MADVRYKRVNRASPCQICGKPDWCSRTIDSSISFCARVTSGADRLSLRQGWGVFYHDRELLNQFPKTFPKTRREPKNFYKKQPEEIKLAPLEIRDFIYASLLRLSPASDYSALTHGNKGLFERGLSNFENYGGLPGSASDRKDLAARLRILLNQNFADFVRQNPLGLQHIPGFWIDGSGEANLWQNLDFTQPLLIVPFRNPTGKIQGCQIRFTGEIKGHKKRYLWLSLPASGSASSGTPLHFADWKCFGRGDFPNKPLLVTEGALKADVAARFRPDFCTIANGGISCSQEIIVNVSRGKPLYLAFDTDWKENGAVARSLGKLLKLRIENNRENQSFAATKIFTWSRTEKGIDDALLKGEKLDEISIQDWFAALDDKCRDEVRAVWTEFF